MIVEEILLLKITPASAVLNSQKMYSPPTPSDDSTQLVKIMWGRSGLRSNKQGVYNVKKTNRHTETKKTKTQTASRHKTASENRRKQ